MELYDEILFILNIFKDLLLLSLFNIILNFLSINLISEELLIIKFDLIYNFNKSIFILVSYFINIIIIDNILYKIK